MIDIKKLKEIQVDLEKRSKQLLKEKIQDEVIQFVKSSVFKNDFLQHRTRKETKHSARVLNNWEKEGLIDKINTDEGKFRTYNKMQSIWLDLVSTLRDFGFALDKIKVVKDTLFNSKGVKFSPLEFAVLQSILSEPMVLVVYTEGNINILPLTQYTEVLQISPMPPHLYFNLLSLADNEFPNNNFNTVEKSAKAANLSENELTLLYYIRTGDFESIKIRLKEGEVYLLEGTKKIEKKSKITEVLKQGSYQDIEIKTQNGAIVHFASTQKIKL